MQLPAASSAGAATAVTIGKPASRKATSVERVDTTETVGGAAAGSVTSGDSFRWKASLWADGDEHPPGGQGVLFDPEVRHEIGSGEFRGIEFLSIRAQSIINTLKRPIGLPFDHTINAYRGCSHACTYCFARPTHEYLGLNVGDDFNRRIVVKRNAAELLRVELAPSRWSGAPIAMGTNTDPYQLCEGKFHLTRKLIEVMVEFGNPFSILTKSTLVLRDLDLLTRAAAQAEVSVGMSVGTMDDDIWRATEPGTPPPARRMRAVRRLNDAGVSCGVLIGPVLPGLTDTDDHLDEVVGAAVEAGATWIGSGTLYLRPGVREYFLAELARTHPRKAADYDKLYKRVNAPAALRKDIGRRIAERVRAHGGPVGNPARFRRDPPKPDQRHPPGASNSTAQLALEF